MDKTPPRTSKAPHLIQFQRFQMPPEPCDYFADRSCVYHFAQSFATPPDVLYASLCVHGWRRQGQVLYRPGCPNCRECIPCRVNAVTFQPDATMKRILRRNSDLALRIEDIPTDTSELYELYVRYVLARHPGSLMCSYSEEEFRRAVLDTCCTTKILEYRLDKRLVCAAITDVLSSGLSAVYTFFDPGMPQRSLGTFSILRQINLAERFAARKYLYLGYWLPSVKNMSYKTRFQPSEVFWDNMWQPLQDCISSIQSELHQRQAARA